MSGVRCPNGKEEMLPKQISWLSQQRFAAMSELEPLCPSNGGKVKLLGLKNYSQNHHLYLEDNMK